MKVKFYIYVNEQVNVTPTFSNQSNSPEMPLSFPDRSKRQLGIQLEKLKALAAEIEKDLKKLKSQILPVILCGEDFFQGGDISTKEESTNNKGECFDANTAYDFLYKDLTALSKEHPKILMVPGSMYVSYNATNDSRKYVQNDSIIKGGNNRVYVQNIAPVVYDGTLLRIIKKGAYLKIKSTDEMVLTIDKHQKVSRENATFVVPEYGEDDLDTMNHNIVFVGKTLLPIESEFQLTPESEMYHHTFTVEGIKFGLEICRDHSRELLKDEKSLSFHLLCSNGIYGSYNACGDSGYFIQADEGHFLTRAYTGKNSNNQVKLTPSVSDVHYLETEPLPIVPYKQQLKLMVNELAQLISSYYYQTPTLKHGLYANRDSAPVRELKACLNSYLIENVDLSTTLKNIIDISTKLGTKHPIACKAAEIQGVVTALIKENAPDNKELFISIKEPFLKN